MNKLKKGLTYISERGSQYRFSDKEQDEKWLQPVSEYIPLEPIMRGQPVSIALSSDIEVFARNLALKENVPESEIKSKLDLDTNTFIVLTNPAVHTNTIGLAFEPSPGVIYDTESKDSPLSPLVLPDKIHVLENGRFDIDPDYLLKSFQVEDVGKLVSDVLNETEYIPEFFTQYNYESLIGKQIYIKGNEKGKLTIVQEEAYLGYNNIIKLGFISDAWLTPVNFNEVKALQNKKDRTSEEDKKLAKLLEDLEKTELPNCSVSIQVQIQGDDRGALDSTLFEGILGEDVYIPHDNKIRVFAVGQEDDVPFSARINITPSASLKAENLPDFSWDTAFIGFQKMDGKTALVSFSDKFTVAGAKDTGFTEDAAFLTIANTYNPDFYNKSEDFIFTAEYDNNANKNSIKATTESLKAAISKAWASVTATEENPDGDTLTFEEFPVTDEGTSSYLKITANTTGGYYYMHISESLKSYFMVDSFTIANGSSDNRGFVVLADNRIAARQNIIGIYNSGYYDTWLKKGTKCVFMHDGLFRYEDHPYNTFNDESTIGCEYFLGRNGTIRRFADTAYDTVVKVLDVQDKDKLLIHCDNARVRTRGGDLPLGYMKPAVRVGDKFVPEYGFLLMDGVTRYPYETYKLLYTRLSAWYPESRLDLKIADGDTEKSFIIPKCTTVTDNMGDDSVPTTVQIKAMEYGIYEKEPRVPYIRKFDNFESEDANKTIIINGHEYLPGVIIPTIGKYTVKIGDEIIEKDTRFEITPICDLSIMESGVEEPTIENLDIHLYVDPETNHDVCGLYHWVEIRNGFQNFNNNTTYGFEWKVEKEEPSNDNPFGRYFLSTNVKDGMGLYYQTSSNIAPTPLSGKAWKLVVSRRENVAQQYDLDGVMHAYLRNRAEDEQGVPYTNKAVTGAAVIHAIEHHYNVRKLVAYPDAENEEKSSILLGKETAPASEVSLASVAQIPVYSPNGIKFETTLKNGDAEDVKTVYRNNWFEVVAGMDSAKNPVSIPSIEKLNDNQLITKAQSREHSDLLAVDDRYPENSLERDRLAQHVHGMVFGVGGNIDAALIDGLRLGRHHSEKVTKSDELENDKNHESYIPYTYYGYDSLIRNGSATYDFITKREGVIINATPDADAVHGNAYKGIYSSTVYEDTTADILTYRERLNTNYKVFSTKVTGNGQDSSEVDLEIKYNFNGNVSESNADSTSIKTQDGVVPSYDFEFNKTVVKDGAKVTSPASIKVGAIGITSKANFKRIFDEIYNPYGYTNEVSTVIGNNKPSGAKKVFTTSDDMSEVEEYLGSALQAAYEMPLAFWQYNNEPTWYKKYLGIIIDRVNDIRDHLTTTDERTIFNTDDQTWNTVDKDNAEVKSTKPFSKEDNTYTYSEDEIKSIKTYLNSVTDNAESAQNLISSVGLLMKAAKETQERLLKIETSTFGADAPTVPGYTPDKKILLPQTPDITAEATHLGLNRLIRAMSIELYGTANPYDKVTSDYAESNNTQTTLSRIDELEVELEGATFDKEVGTDSADNKLLADSSTYPYEVNKETSVGGVTKYEVARTDFIRCDKNDDGTYTYHSKLQDTDIVVTDEHVLYYLDKNDISNGPHGEYKLNTQGVDALIAAGHNDELYAKEDTIDILANQNPIDGRKLAEGETENSENHATWTKIHLGKDARFEQVDGKFIADTDHNIVPEDNRYNFNGTIDAISRICTKVNALTYSINGKDNINSTPERLNTIRNNIETLIKEAFFDGAPETTVTLKEGDVKASAKTEDIETSQAYIDEDLDWTDKERTVFAQPSIPYEKKVAKDGKGKNYTGISRFDQLSNALYNYTIEGFTANDTLYTNVNSDNYGKDVSDPAHVAIQYTSEDDIARGAKKTQVLVGRTFNNKRLLIDGINDSTGANVTDFDQTHSDSGMKSSFHINVPDSIEEYEYASIIDILIDAIGPSYFRHQIDNVNGTKSDQDLRSSRTITERLLNLEGALDNVVRKLCQHSAFELDTEKVLNDNDLFEGSASNSTFSIESFIRHLNNWLGMSTLDDEHTTWKESGTAELACGYALSLYKENDGVTDKLKSVFRLIQNNKYTDLANVVHEVAKDDPNVFYYDSAKASWEPYTTAIVGQTPYYKIEAPVLPDDYLDSPAPIVNSNYVIKQLLKRLRKEESYYQILTSILGTDYDLEKAKGSITINVNPETGVQEITGTSQYTLTDDIKDLLLTIYGTDVTDARTGQQTAYMHRTNINDTDNHSYLDTKGWKNPTTEQVVFTGTDIAVGTKVWSTAGLEITNPNDEHAETALVGTVVHFTDDTIEVDTGSGLVIYNAYVDGNHSEAFDGHNTRFTGNEAARNIIDDIIKETYFVPNPVQFTSTEHVETTDGVDHRTYTNNTTEIVDSKDVDYNTNHTYYDFDNDRYHYDYEHNANDPAGGAVGKAIGYQNRDSLFNDYKYGDSRDYRRSRFEVLEDEIRHLRSFLGLNEILGNTKIGIDAAAETVYGGKFYGTADTDLAGHKFSGDATRNGNFFMKTNAASANAGTSAESNLLTMLFNISNALRDISRELGKEVKYQGTEYPDWEHLNTDRGSQSIYARLSALENLTGSLLGITNPENDGIHHDENEEDTSGVLDIQWIEE